MDKEYLLTFRVRGDFTFEWFDTEEELTNRVEELNTVSGISDIEVLYINVIKKLI